MGNLFEFFSRESSRDRDFSNQLRFSRFRIVAMTKKPRRNISSVVSRPKPLEHPVINTTLGNTSFLP
jgi:hypothetical protein